MASTSVSMELPEVIPAVRDSGETKEQRTRNVVICLDGTGDQFDSDNSNVVKFFAALKKDDPTQLCYYQTGVGTYSSSYKDSLKSGVSAALDMAVGSSLGVHVREAYSFLMQNYREGDKICLIGFSRGAYTARALAGMLHKVGLLPAHNQAQIPFAYKWYKDNSHYGWDMSAEFKRTFSIDVSVYFMGCWDTVASVGIIPRFLPFAKTSNSSVSFFRHALALDERRSKFKANHWLQRNGRWGDSIATGASPAEVLGKISHPNADDTEESFHRALSAHHRRQAASEKRSRDATHGPPSAFASMRQSSGNGNDDDGGATLAGSNSDASSKAGKVSGEGDQPKGADCAAADGDKKGTSNGPSRRDIADHHASALKKQGKNKEQLEFMREFERREQEEFGPEERGTDALEVWFLGCHADCGGGAVPNETRHMLSRIPLRWMIRQTFACNTGLLFHTDVLAEHGLDIDTLWPRLAVTPHVPAVKEPAPSALDSYASHEIPPLTVRRDTIRRRILGSERRAYCGTDASSSSSSTFAPPPPPPGETMAAPKTENTTPHGYLPEAHEDYFDSLASINDQLKEAKGWWVLELWPIKYRVRKGHDNWHKKIGPNMGRYRTIRQRHPKVHWTVFERARQLGYEIQCAVEDDVDWNVVY